LAATPGAHVPDAYYACDICFVPPVAQLYPEAVLLTQTPIVIAVPIGNPKNIHSLIDLSRPGMRVGLCNAEQGSLGFITKRMLTRMNLWAGIERNSSSQTPTADLLIAQLLVGSLDAAIVYATNVRLQKDRLIAISINNPAAKAVQPFAIAKDSANRQIALRLLSCLQAHRSVFTDIGFEWRDDQRPVLSSVLPPIGGDVDAMPPGLLHAR
jgi:molybdate transport system substrate-binding protein